MLRRLIVSMIVALSLFFIWQLLLDRLLKVVENLSLPIKETVILVLPGHESQVEVLSLISPVQILGHLTCMVPAD